MVITPSLETFQALNESLKELSSYDGADQGFLTAFFGTCMKEAELFNPKRDLPASMLPKSQRLSIIYNLPHTYYYEDFSLRKYKSDLFIEDTLPAYSIGYPITPILKPWYWLGYFFFDMNWYWYDIRVTLQEKNTWNILMKYIFIYYNFYFLCYYYYYFYTISFLFFSIYFCCYFYLSIFTRSIIPSLITLLIFGSSTLFTHKLLGSLEFSRKLVRKLEIITVYTGKGTFWICLSFILLFTWSLPPLLIINRLLLPPYAYFLFFSYITIGYWSTLEYFSVARRSILGINTAKFGFFPHTLLSWLVLIISFYFCLPRYLSLIQKIIFYVSTVALYSYSLYSTMISPVPQFFGHFISGVAENKLKSEF